MGLKNKNFIYTYSGFPGGSDSKISAFNAGDTGEVNGYPLQYSCLENSMDRGTGGLQSLGLQRIRYD